MELPSLNIILILGTAIFIITSILLYLLINKNQQVQRLRASFGRLKKSFENLDEQAKLIVKTDLELNKTQETLDKRLNSLDSLQKTSRLISTTLDEKEIFLRLDQSMGSLLDFEKNIIILFDENKNLHEKLSVGFSQEDIDFIIAHFSKESNLLSSLAEGHSFSSINSPTQRKETIFRLFNVSHFIITPILIQSGILGIVFVGNISNTSVITEGDEELISILASQIGQAIENARLFEEVFKSSRVLESKVQDRTKQLADALENVEKISKTKSEFISAVSHELRTPLTSIKGYAAILIAGKLGEVPEQVKKRLEKINTHSDNLVKLINDLLDISRIESGRVEMRLTKCDIAHIIENIHDLLTPQIKTKNINWVTHISEHIPEMLLDSSQIERIFINLVGNAIKFTPENGTITIETHVDKDILTVAVSDTGIGIKQEDIDRLFDEFFRVENTINQNVKGTGLGLPLAKKIVEAHGGTMWITSKLNEGTTFHFTLAIKKE